MKFMQRVLTTVLAAAMIVCCSSVPVSAAKTSETAEKAVSSIKVGWNLGNSLDSNGAWIAQYTSGKPSDYEKAWGNPVTTKALITFIKKQGYNAVRVPVTWAEHIDKNGKIDKDWLDRVQTVVDYVISQDMYCILNVHHDGGSEGWLVASEESYKSNSKKFAGLWKNIAARFKDYGDKLMFESFNEMLDSKDSWTESKDSKAYSVINKYNQLFVDTVRASGGNNGTRNLMLQTYSAAHTEKTLKNFVLPKDTVKNHLIVQVHDYDPTAFTFPEKDVTWTKSVSTWGSDTDKKNMDKVFAIIGKYSDSLGVPFVVGEFGATFKNNNSSRAKFAEYYVKKAAEYGIKCFWWDDSDPQKGYSLVDRSSCKLIHSEVVKAMTAAGAKAGSSSSSSASDNSTGNKLSAPVMKKFTKKNGYLKVNWGAVEGADSYKVYRADSASGKKTLLKTTKNTYYIDKTAKAGKKYYYFVKAYNSSTKITSSYSKGKSVTLPASDKKQS